MGLAQSAATNGDFEMETRIYGLVCELEIFDDGTLDTCVMVTNKTTERGTVLRYDSEYRSEFDTEAEFLTSAFEDFCEQLDHFLQHHSNF